MTLRMHGCGVTTQVDRYQFPSNEEDVDSLSLTEPEEPCGVVVLQGAKEGIPFDHPEALPLLTTMVQQAQEHYGAAHPFVAMALSNFVAACGIQHREIDAFSAAALAASIARSTNSHSMLCPVLHNLGLSVEAQRAAEDYGTGREWRCHQGWYYCVMDPVYFAVCTATEAIPPPIPVPIHACTQEEQGGEVNPHRATLPTLDFHVGPIPSMPPPRTKPGGLEPADLLRDLVLCANRGTVHMQHSDGKSTLTMSHVGDVHKYLLCEMWPPLEKFLQTYARFAAYLRAQGDTTRERVSTAWTHPIHDIKVKQDALTGLLDAYYRKVFRSHQPRGPTQFDVAVGAPDSLTPSNSVIAAYDEAIRLNNILLFARAAVTEATAATPAVPSLRADIKNLTKGEVLTALTAATALLGKHDEEWFKTQLAQYTFAAEALLYAVAVALGRVTPSSAATNTQLTDVTERDAKARHKWFLVDGVHLKDMSCVERISCGPRSKVFLVRHNKSRQIASPNGVSSQRNPSDVFLSVKEISLLNKDGTEPLDARESDKRVSKYCQLWERLSLDARSAQHLICPSDVFFKSYKLKIIAPYAGERSLNDALVNDMGADRFCSGDVARALLQAASFLHSLGVFHGMITLRDVLVTTTHTIYLNDVGIALLYDLPHDAAADLKAIGECVACVHFKIPVTLKEELLAPALLNPERCPAPLFDFVEKCSAVGATAESLLLHPFIRQQ